MENENVIKSLEFLVRDYKCIFSYEFNYGSKYLYKNDIFKVIVFTWEEFHDVDINLVYSMKNYHIDPFFEEPQMMSIIESKKKGIRGFFYNYDRDFWKIVSVILKNKLIQLGV